VEYEQVLTHSWSAVAFVDALGAAARLADYPFDQRLYSVGLGLRYQTIVGPIRLEYGRNLNKRPTDPSGTLHLSIGVAF
jgi:outer membrane translocation and assembly module TamA